MRASDREVLLVLAMTVLLVALPTALVLRQPLVALALVAPLALVARRLWSYATLPDPWRAFERELDGLGVVVDDRHGPDGQAVRPVHVVRQRRPAVRRRGSTTP